ncbi:peptidoglycan-binding protein [Clavibacter sp. VKM Ac-2872]|uniref:peptidoglycan-binding domain-containing protein n=1 Tax=Clavibacter sp. VKM Ac-2872 TaxID=2783812 RepID=UPI00188BD863|nr:peptidoglycan-binding domain-containing protein [Clavibacter sp. VKM Ac-2872]MBF4624544.1 peptidoglycan-binding protein [Clavibacter sp. VKM Ac-2872]
MTSVSFLPRLAIITGIIAAACLTQAPAAMAVGADQAPAAAPAASGSTSTSQTMISTGTPPDVRTSDAASRYCNEHYSYYNNSAGERVNYFPAYEDVSIETGRCTLEKGTRGEGVATLQASLNQCYHRGLTEDGIFGAATYNALLAVQRQIGVTVDGVYGPNTGSAMLHTGDTCRRVPADVIRQ